MQNVDEDHNSCNCRYIRHKLKIVADTPMYILCNTYLKTISHIHLHCIHTNTFIKILEDFIKRKVDRNYKDSTKINFIVCNHTLRIINHFNIVAKWYISKRFQAGEIPICNKYVVNCYWRKA